jgi:hypothetical protein
MQINEISLLMRLFLGAIGTFFAILVWSKTRNPAWVFIILGIIFQYVIIVFETLENFGIVFDKMNINNQSIFNMLILNIPMICFIIGLIIFLIRKKI